MYQALYRKWRPRDFSDVVGQEHITETLRQQVASGRLSHAYLFVGTRGTGKTTCAKILAKAANCEHPENGNPCNKCQSCIGIDDGSILDVEELDAASNNGVDNIRTIRDEAVFSPAAVRKRVYIIDEVHMLSTSAFNALLKILEEPPEHLIFILATTEIHKVPATILSRCQRYSFKRLAAGDISQRMKYIAAKENVELTEEAADILARLADGSMRDGLSLLDQCVWNKIIDASRVLSAVGLAGAENTLKLFDFIVDEQIGNALELLDALYMEGKDVGSVLEELCSMCRDALISKVASNGGEGLMSGGFSKADLEKAGKLPPAKLLYMVKTIQSALVNIDRSANRKISAELCLLELCDERLSDDVSALSARVTKLESKGSGYINQSQDESLYTTKIDETQMYNIKDEIKPAKSQIKKNIEEDDDLPPWNDISEIKDKEAEQTFELPYEKSDVVQESRQGSGEETKCRDGETENFRSCGDTWKDILAIIEKQIDIAPFSFLSDKAHSEGELLGNVLTVGTKNIIAKSMIETEPVTTALKHAAETVAGHPVIVKITDYKNKPGQTANKLEQLKKFGNIKFE